MKVILTGSTGFIGGEVLKQCLADPQIDSLIILSRRKLPNLDGNSKAKVVLVEDFTRYPEEVTRQLDGSDACIW
jgi:nucleoside-diphosphate-sugar epimerase